MSGTAHDTEGAPSVPSDTASEDFFRKPSGPAPRIMTQNAPMLTCAEGFEDWSHKYASFLQSYSDRYRLMLEGAAVGNSSYETNLYFSILFSVGDFPEALHIVSVYRKTRSVTKGTQAWKALEERYMQVTHTRVQTILDRLFQKQGDSETPVQFVHRINRVYHELILTNYDIERIVTHLMMDGLKPAYDSVRQMVRMQQDVLTSIPTTMEKISQLADLHDANHKNSYTATHSPTAHLSDTGRGPPQVGEEDATEVEVAAPRVAELAPMDLLHLPRLHLSQLLVQHLQLLRLCADTVMLWGILLVIAGNYIQP